MYDAFRGGFGCLVFLGFVVLLFYPFWRLCTKAGYPGVICLLFFVPLVNVILLWIAALTEWPIERQLRDLKARAGMPTG
jgi:hypothetical protein